MQIFEATMAEMKLSIQEAHVKDMHIYDHI